MPYLLFQLSCIFGCAVLESISAFGRFSPKRGLFRSVRSYTYTRRGDFTREINGWPFVGGWGGRVVVNTINDKSINACARKCAAVKSTRAAERRLRFFPFLFTRLSANRRVRAPATREMHFISREFDEPRRAPDAHTRPWWTNQSPTPTARRPSYVYIFSLTTDSLLCPEIDDCVLKKIHFHHIFLFSSFCLIRPMKARPYSFMISCAFQFHMRVDIYFYLR